MLMFSKLWHTHAIPLWPLQLLLVWQICLLAFSATHWSCCDRDLSESLCLSKILALEALFGVCFSSSPSNKQQAAQLRNWAQMHEFVLFTCMVETSSCPNCSFLFSLSPHPSCAFPPVMWYWHKQTKPGVIQPLSRVRQNAASRNSEDGDSPNPFQQPELCFNIQNSVSGLQFLLAKLCLYLGCYSAAVSGG